ATAFRASNTSATESGRRRFAPRSPPRKRRPPKSGERRGSFSSWLASGGALGRLVANVFVEARGLVRADDRGGPLLLLRLVGVLADVRRAVDERVVGAGHVRERLIHDRERRVVMVSAVVPERKRRGRREGEVSIGTSDCLAVHLADVVC